MFFGLYPKDASYSSDEVSLALFKLAKNTVLSVLVGILGAVFLFATAESRVACLRGGGQQFRCYEARAILGFWEVRERALPELGKEEIRSRLSEIGEAPISEFLSGQGPAKVLTGERVPLSLLWWIISGFCVFAGVYSLLWFPIELYYWLSHRERPAG